MNYMTTKEPIKQNK